VKRFTRRTKSKMLLMRRSLAVEMPCFSGGFNWSPSHCDEAVIRLS